MSSADGDERRSPIEDDEPVKGAPPAPEEFSRGKVCLLFILPFFMFSLCCLACVCVCVCAAMLTLSHEGTKHGWPPWPLLVGCGRRVVCVGG
jgi:hypothetical protein